MAYTRKEAGGGRAKYVVWMMIILWIGAAAAAAETEAGMATTAWVGAETEGAAAETGAGAGAATATAWVGDQGAAAEKTGTGAAGTATAIHETETAWLGRAAETEAAVSCSGVTQGIQPCVAFLVSSSAKQPSPSCCAAARGLDDIAKGPGGEWKTMCPCLNSNIGKTAVPQNAAALTNMCGLTTVRIGRDIRCP